LFTAAAAIDYATRPILLFYGLSQAGRAVAAASTAADNDSYRLSGHGIEAVNLSQRPPLHLIELIDKGRGSFTRLASLLACGSLPKGAPFGQIWATIPDLRDSPLDTGSTEYKPPLRCEEQYPEGVGELTGSIRLPWYLGEAPDAAAIEAYLAAYPTLSGCAKIQIHAEAMVGSHDGKHGVEPMRGSDDHHERRLRAVFGIGRAEMTLQTRPGSPAPAQPYIEADDLWLFPATGRAALPLHPLLSWWALLFALSMLARYESASWIGHLDIDASPDAIKLRAALDLALDTCPQLVLGAIRSVSR
jgi:hypothetical protein